jgi:hypothetical protein
MRNSTTNGIHFLSSASAIGCALLFLCGQTSVSHANSITLAPGGSIAASAEPFPAAGSSLLATTSVGFSSGSLSGTLISSVYDNDAGNEYGLADMTFTYEILLTGGPDAASAISIGSFAGFLTDVSYDSNGGVAPHTISRDPTGSQAVKFDFSGNGYIAPGQDSALLVVQTDATAWGSGSASVIDDIGTPSIRSFAPAVPDTTGIGSFILGLGLLAGVGRLTKAAVLKSENRLTC